MDKIGPFFKCTKCGALYNADPIHHGNPSLTDDERTELRNAWLKTIDKFNTEGLRPEQIKAAEAAELVACGAYANTIVWQSWGVPNNLITVKDANGHRLECQTHHAK